MTVINFIRAIERPASCRICRSHEEKNITFFQNPIGNTNGIPQTGENAILNGINKFLPITIMEDDGFSPIVCFSCVFNLMLFQELVTTFNKTREQAKAEKYDCCYICAKNDCFFYPVCGTVNRLLTRIRKDASPDTIRDDSDVSLEDRMFLRVCVDCLFLLEKCRDFQKTAKATDRRLRRLPLDDSADEDSADERPEGIVHLLHGRRKDSRPVCSSHCCNSVNHASEEVQCDHDYDKRSQSRGTKNSRKRKKTVQGKKEVSNRGKKSRVADNEVDEKAVKNTTSKRKQPKKTRNASSKKNTKKTGDDAKKGDSKKNISKNNTKNKKIDSSTNEIPSSDINKPGPSRKRKSGPVKSNDESNKRRRSSRKSSLNNSVDISLPTNSSSSKRKTENKNNREGIVNAGTSSVSSGSQKRINTRSSSKVVVTDLKTRSRKH